MRPFDRLMAGSPRIACAMSGGVDSSVAAYLLKAQGFDVIGVTLKLWECFKTSKRQTCCSIADTNDARCVCDELKIPHHVIDMKAAFKKDVVEYFASEYTSGRTPNPCIKCNDSIKFGLLREEAKRLFGTDIIATGHYARIGKGGELWKGVDLKKDQSYFLFTLKKNHLDKTLFPVGGYKKEEVRKIADKAGLKTAPKKESQEVCFITDDDYGGFISDYYPHLARPRGNFVDLNGKVIGRHNGIHGYTVGQRRGLGFGFGRRKYIVRIDPKKEEIVLGDHKDLYRGEMEVKDVNWLVDTISSRVEVKVRYRQKAFLAKVVDGKRIIFDSPQAAITPGQAAVFYKGKQVLGGGWIV